MLYLATLRSIRGANAFSPSPLKDVQVLRKELINYWSDAADPGKSEWAGRNKMLKDFKKETRVLKLLRHTRNPRIVKILGSYVYKGVYNLLFPLADMDLDDFLQGKPAPWVFRHTDEIVEELRGLATALNDVHSYRCQETELELIGCHHDLKPSNILIFGGRLTLADFGLSRLIPPEQGSGTDFKDCLGDYFSPESLDENFSRQKIGRASDIWSFGCVIIEVITFCEYGVKGVNQFRSIRRTEGRPRYMNSWFHSGGKMKIEVDHWLSKLQGETQDESISALAALARNMLDESPDSRPRADDVHVEIASIALKSLARRLAKQFEAFLGGHGDFGLDTEKKRFDEWCDGMGITTTTSLETNSRIEILTQFCSEIRQHMLAMCELIPVIPQAEGIPAENHSTEDLEELYLSVREHNDFLWKIRPPETRKRMQAHWHRRRLETARLGELEAIEQSADREMASLATMKRLFLQMEQNQRSGDAAPLDPDDIIVLKAFGEHSLGIYGRQGPNQGLEEVESRKKVILEWWWVKDWDLSLIEELYVRMSMIASLPNVPDRPSEFCVLSCEGYFFDDKDKRFGVVYATPAADAPPVTLREFIDKNQSVSQGHRPPLGDRFALALAVGLCVAEFHAVGWLHHDLCSDNVIFFSPSSSTATIRHPYIIGFNHSRPDEDGNYTLERTCADLKLIYQHPDYRAPAGRRRFHKVFDYYSLGVVLLEIGMWYGVQGFGDELKGLRLVQKRDKLVEYAQRLGAYMGQMYRDAVLHCLKGEYDDGLNVEEMFHQKVLGPLSRCAVW
jgi:serine/threonine protein kinase